MKVKINNEILRWARQQSHLSLDELADKMNKPVEVITQWEEGLDLPTYPQLEKLSYQILKRPIAIFFLPNPPKVDEIGSSFRTLPDTDDLLPKFRSSLNANSSC